MVLRGGCVLRFATGSALSGKHFGFRNTDGGYATETPTQSRISAYVQQINLVVTCELPTLTLSHPKKRQDAGARYTRNVETSRRIQQYEAAGMKKGHTYSIRKCGWYMTEDVKSRK